MSAAGTVTTPPPTLLCIANYPSNTGYAWDYIERLFGSLADRFASHGIRTMVAYPAIPEPPRSLIGSSAIPVILDASLRNVRSIATTAAFIRREGVRVVYLTDRAVWSTAFPVLRAAGARAIVVHDHTSGARTVPRGVKRWVKQLLAMLPWINADHVVAVSGYVARRHIEVGMRPSDRVMTISNGLPVPPEGSLGRGLAHRELSLDPARPLVACAARAVPEKGVVHLMRAFAIVGRRLPGPRPALVYVGDGPERPALEALSRTLGLGDDVFLLGYRSDAAALVGSADVAVVPSIWDEACALTVLESMGRGVPVVASRVGGIPELVHDGVTGLLVPRGDEEQLAEAILRVLGDPTRARAMGAAGRRRVVEDFSPEHQLDLLAGIVGRRLAPGAA
jgi:glycosyltransferase involved in cell wall biosynthesis